MRQEAARVRSAPRALILAVLTLAACGPAIDTTFDDAAITARVRRALLNDPIVRGLPVTVETRAGLVTLTGDVRSEAQASHAAAVARTVAGVVEIESRLRVVVPAARGGSPVSRRPRPFHHGLPIVRRAVELTHAP